MDSDLEAALARIEQRQSVYERVAHELVSAIGVQTEMLTAILKAATIDPRPEPGSRGAAANRTWDEATDGAAGPASDHAGDSHPRGNERRA